MVSNVTGILAGERRGLTGNETVSGLKLVGYKTKCNTNNLCFLNVFLFGNEYFILKLQMANPLNVYFFS
jgi:hypothetical protein